MLRLIAELGGYVSTPGKKEMPGTQTLWIGLQRTYDFAMAWKTFGPDVGDRHRTPDGNGDDDVGNTENDM
jgi:hypothetical protein